MDISRMLDVAIGLFFVFLLLSVLSSWIQELIAAILKTRSRDLIRTIERLFDPSLEKTEGIKNLEKTFTQGNKVGDKLKENAVKAFYEHPLIQGLGKSPKSQPSYIAAKDFSQAVVDLFVKAGTEQLTPADKAMAKARKGIEQLDTPGKETLLLLADRAADASDKAEEQVAALRENVENWYDSQMERASGWYKRRMQVWAVGTGLVLAVVFNADTLHIVKSLWNDSALRTVVAEQAATLATEGDDIDANKANALLDEFPIPLGWQEVNMERIHGAGALFWLLGILLTAGGVSAGSPFWFDVLNRLVNLRSAGGKPAPAAGAGAGGKAS